MVPQGNHKILKDEWNNKDITYQSLRNATNAIHTVKIIDVNAFTKKEERSQINNLPP